MKKKNYKCLMIQTKDNRRFFTPEKNYVQLIEFANTFDAEISVVKLEEGEVLDLEPLAKAISCNAYFPTKENFEILERRIGDGKLSSKNITAAKEIKDWLKSKFDSGEVVDSKELQEKFSHYGLSYNAISAHLHKMRQTYRKSGFNIEKLSPGRYRLANRDATGVVLRAIDKEDPIKKKEPLRESLQRAIIRSLSADPIDEPDDGYGLAANDFDDDGDD